ncbi:MAG: phosphoribosyltransferase [Acidimicrobiia bacterium]|nr:phosphoribosyltransferase [Acidimicrobiia bacterium]NNL27555.1 phosphoribosyltransferase [Acidimicrobiia bacterium]
MVPMFRNRSEAGLRLAERLDELHLADPLILGLPRGGVPVARAVADHLRADLDFVLVRKLGHPRQPELAIGAIGEYGHIVVNDVIIKQTGVSESELAGVVERERSELARRVETYRSARPAFDIADRLVVLVDDGIATGATMRAAVEVVRSAPAAGVIVAVPVAPPSAIESFSDLVDEVVVVEVPQAMGSVGQFYADFSQTTDQEVVQALLGREGG